MNASELELNNDQSLKLHKRDLAGPKSSPLYDIDPVTEVILSSDGHAALLPSKMKPKTVERQPNAKLELVQWNTRVTPSLKKDSNPRHVYLKQNKDELKSFLGFVEYMATFVRSLQAYKQSEGTHQKPYTIHMTGRTPFFI
ncbi:hypothetical protein NDU88_003419 [Pleurodeles waltl]|uniref:Uncharacterized protein n=1 Tax=Pleurodeles waltl TaxID=8319 RepID=A0AAV7WP07_PLEWA|nr:hypothetical protein NDU88_003419 [Pleurodeles waltl]